MPTVHIVAHQKPRRTQKYAKLQPRVFYVLRGCLIPSAPNPGISVLLWLVCHTLQWSMCARMDGQPTASGPTYSIPILVQFRRFILPGGRRPFCTDTPRKAKGAQTLVHLGSDGRMWRFPLPAFLLFRFSPKHSRLKAASTANYDPHVFAKTNTHGFWGCGNTQERVLDAGGGEAGKAGEPDKCLGYISKCFRRALYVPCRLQPWESIFGNACQGRDPHLPTPVNLPHYFLLLSWLKTRCLFVALLLRFVLGLVG